MCGKAKNYRAAIFDLDGTLLNTIEDISDACNIVLAREGYPTYSVMQYKGFVGSGIKHLIHTILAKEGLTEEGIDIMLSKLKEEFAQHLTTKTKPYPGIVETLAELEGRGIKISILSNKPHSMVKKTVQGLLPQFRFHTVMGAHDAFPHKPDPESTLHVMKQMEESPDTIVFIGDSEIDIRTAKNAGIASIGVAWGFRKTEVLFQEGANIIVNEPRELLKYF